MKARVSEATVVMSIAIKSVMRQSRNAVLWIGEPMFLLGSRAPAK